MSDDLVRRLRECADCNDYRDYEEGKLFLEAAARIEHLERLFNRDYEEMRQQAADNARLVEAADKRIEALEAIIDGSHTTEPSGCPTPGACSCIDAKSNRIKTLEAALREIHTSPMHDTAYGHVMQLREFARCALEGT